MYMCVYMRVCSSTLNCELSELLPVLNFPHSFSLIGNNCTLEGSQHVTINLFLPDESAEINPEL